MDIELRFIRFQRLVGFDSFEKLHNSKVIVFGVGGVGGYVVESLARAGVGTIGVVDNDTVNLTTINRKIIATDNTINEYKTDAVEARIHSISPECKIIKYTMFYLPETKIHIPLEEYDYIVDAIDTVTAKLTLIEEATHLNIPIISSMGTGNRLDPSKLIFTDISKIKDISLFINSFDVLYIKTAPIYINNISTINKPICGLIKYAIAFITYITRPLWSNKSLYIT